MKISLGQPIFTLGCNRFSGNCRQYAVLLWHISHENPDRGNQNFSGNYGAYYLWCNPCLYSQSADQSL